MLIVYWVPWEHKMHHNWPSSLLHGHVKWWNGSALQASLSWCRKRVEKIKSYFAKTKGFSVETTVISAHIDDSAQCSSSIVKTEKSTAGVHDSLVCAVPTSLKSCSSDPSILPMPKQGDSVSQSITITRGDGCPMDEIQDTWIIHNNCSLSLSDKAVIEQGEQLIDKHVQMAHHLFPLIGGLQCTLLQQKAVKGQCTANTVQIVHCQKRQHWIVASTIFAKKSSVNIYDTLFARLDAETRTTIKRSFGLKSVEGLSMVDMQCQKGTKDCGLFAIAVLTSLLFGEDPGKVVYKQEKLREHLIDCFTAGELSLFPRE